MTIPAEPRYAIPAPDADPETAPHTESVQRFPVAESVRPVQSQSRQGLRSNHRPEHHAVSVHHHTATDRLAHAQRQWPAEMRRRRPCRSAAHTAHAHHADHQYATYSMLPASGLRTRWQSAHAQTAGADWYNAGRWCRQTKTS